MSDAVFHELMIAPERYGVMKAGLNALFDEVFCHEVPVNIVEEFEYVVLAAVLIVKIVCMLPYINAEQYAHAVSKRRGGITGVYNGQLAAYRILYQPGPA